MRKPLLALSKPVCKPMTGPLSLSVAGNKGTRLAEGNSVIRHSGSKPQPKDRGRVVLDQPQRGGSAGTQRLVFDTAALQKMVAVRNDLG